MVRKCLIVCASPLLTTPEEQLIRLLEARGYEVTVAATGRPAFEPNWAVRLTDRGESLLQRRLRNHTRPFPAAIPVPSDAALLVLARELTPSLIVHFGAPDLAGQLAAVADVLQVWLNRRPETLRMESVAAASGAAHELTVTRRRKDAPHEPRVVERSAITSIHAWPALDRAAASTRALVLLLRAPDAPDGEPAAWQDAPVPSVRILAVFTGVVVRSIGQMLLRRWWRPDAWFLVYQSTMGPMGPMGQMGPMGSDPSSSVGSDLSSSVGSGLSSSVGSGLSSSVGSDLSPVGSDLRFPVGSDLRFLLGGPDRFLADPCAVAAGARSYVFCEEYPYRTARGVISVSELQADGTLSQPKVVLDRPYHLSYPFVFEADGQWWMIPETSANRTVELYRAAEFPWQWELHRTLLDNVNATDATLLQHEGRWWMFVTIGEQGSSTWDELFIYYADRFDGPWHPHARNPVKRDNGSARPAGRLFRTRAGLIRPAQDCSIVYGGGIRFMKIDRLTETEFDERELERLDPSVIDGAVALHTWSATPNLLVMDALLPWAPLSAERLHRKVRPKG